MIFRLFKKLNVYNYFIKNKDNHIAVEQDSSDENDSLLLTVPVYFYVDFLKTYFKSITICATIIIGIMIGTLYYPLSNKSIKSETLPWIELPAQVLNEDRTYIQTYSSEIYEEMLKELRRMQETAAYLHQKQEASDQKTLALQHQINKLQMNTKESEFISAQQAQELIKEALELYDSDKLALRDYALESSGGSILSTPQTEAKLSQKSFTFFGLFYLRSYSNPRMLISPDILPGKCFAFDGNYGKVRIKLANKIYVSAVTLEHAARSLLTPEEITSAPKSFAIFGLQADSTAVGYPLGQFMYNINGPSRQTFIISVPNEYSFEIIEFEVLNNHGNDDYTCVYRLRVHGTLIDNINI